MMLLWWETPKERRKDHMSVFGINVEMGKKIVMVVDLLHMCLLK